MNNKSMNHGRKTFLFYCFTILITLSFQLTYLTGQPLLSGSDSLQFVKNQNTFDSLLSNLITETLAENHSIKAATSKITEANESIKKVGNLAPPQFSIEAMDASVGSFPNPLKDQMEMDYSLEQMVEFPGKLSTMKRAESKQKEMATFDKATIERDLVRNVKNAFYEIYLVDRRIEINRSSQAILTRIADVASKQYEVGMGRQADILRAQTEVSLLRKNMSAFEQRRRSMTAMINALRNRPLDTQIDTIGEIAPPGVEFSSEKLLADAIVNRPELKAMQASLEMRKIELTAAKKEYYPDFTIKGTYKDRRPGAIGADQMSAGTVTTTQGNPDKWSIMLGMTIPEAPWSWGKLSSAQKQAQASISRVGEDLAQMKNMIGSEVIDALSEVQSNRTQMDLSVTTILPQAEQAYESALASYRTGGQEFTMLLDAERTLLMARDDYHMTVMNYLWSLAKLERTTGNELTKETL